MNVSQLKQHLFKTHFVSTHHMLGTMKGTWPLSVNKVDKHHCLHGT